MKGNILMLNHMKMLTGGQTPFALSGRMQNMHLTVVEQQLPTDDTHTHMKHVWAVLKENHSMTYKVNAHKVGLSAANVFSILTKHLGKRQDHAK